MEFTPKLEQALKEALTPAQIATLEAAFRSDDPSNWTRPQFSELDGFGNSSAFAAWTVIQQFKAGEVVDHTRAVSLPDFPPYLASWEDYDPTDPTQFWTAPTGEMFRWTGKWHGEFTGQPIAEPKAKDIATRGPEVRRVLQVPHHLSDGIMVPDRDAAARAIRDGYDWFHRGYNTWITRGGKPVREVPRRVRDQVRLAQENYYSGQPFRPEAAPPVPAGAN